MQKHSARSSGSDPQEGLEDFLNTLVADQFWRAEARARSEGLSQEAFEQNLWSESWKIVARMIWERYDTLWPEDESLSAVLAHILQLDLEEGQSLRQAFEQAGWLDSEGQITALGLQTTGLKS